jgi:hypothetical protein
MPSLKADIEKTKTTLLFKILTVEVSFLMGNNAG